MKNIKCKIASIAAVVLALSILAPTALAAEITPFTAYQSASYTIPQGGGTWNGKSNDKLWTVTADETRFNVSITSSTDKTVSADLYKIIVWWPDSVVKSISSFTGSNGDWTSTDSFIPDEDAAHYAVVRSSDANGVTGYVSVQ